MAKLTDLPPELLSLIVQHISTPAEALVFCSASKQLQDTCEAYAWELQVLDLHGRPGKFADAVRVKALRGDRISLFRRLMTFGGVVPDMRDLALASYNDDHDLVDEILSYDTFHASAANLPNNYEFQHYSFMMYPWDFTGFPLANACYLGNMDMFHKLLAVPSIKANINRVWRGPPYLDGIVRHGYYEAEFGCAVHAAAICRNPDVLRAVLDAGGDPDAVNRSGNTPITMTFEFVCPENAETLWLAGADMSPLWKMSKSKLVLRTAHSIRHQPWADFLPFIVHCAPTGIPVTWILAVAVESRCYDLTNALLDADPRLLDTANALLLAYKKFRFPASLRRSLIFKPGRHKGTARKYLPVLHGRTFGPHKYFRGYCF